MQLIKQDPCGIFSVGMVLNTCKPIACSTTAVAVNSAAAAFAWKAIKNFQEKCWYLSCGSAAPWSWVTVLSLNAAKPRSEATMSHNICKNRKLNKDLYGKTFLRYGISFLFYVTSYRPVPETPTPHRLRLHQHGDFSLQMGCWLFPESFRAGRSPLVLHQQKVSMEMWRFSE